VGGFVLGGGDHGEGGVQAPLNQSMYSDVAISSTSIDFRVFLLRTSSALDRNLNASARAS